MGFFVLTYVENLFFTHLILWVLWLPQAESVLGMSPNVHYQFYHGYHSLQILWLICMQVKAFLASSSRTVCVLQHCWLTDINRALRTVTAWYRTIIIYLQIVWVLVIIFSCKLEFVCVNCWRCAQRG